MRLLRDANHVATASLALKSPIEIMEAIMRDCVETSAERGALSTTSKELSEAELSTVAGGGVSTRARLSHNDRPHRRCYLRLHDRSLTPPWSIASASERVPPHSDTEQEAR